MKKRYSVKEGLGLSGTTMILTAITTIVASIAVEFIDGSKNPLIYTICDRAFYLSLALLLIEIMLEVYKIRKSTNAIASTIHQTENVLFPPEESERVEGYITKALQHKKADKIQIICYGTSKYGKIIDKLINEFPKIDAEIVVCSPDLTILDYSYDKALLRSVTKEIAKRPNTTVYISNIPPTVRASLILTRNKSPLFCTMQTYLICPEEESALFRGKNKVPSIVAQDEYSPILFNLKASFEHEFNRLIDNSVKYSSSEVKLLAKPKR